MYQADLKHSNHRLEEKLQNLYRLNRGERNIELAFRPPYIKLLEAFGNPHKSLPPTIHVAGTNGKGSTIAILKSIYETAGYKVHAYTSPHLVRFNERIMLGGMPIDDTGLEALIDEAITLNENRDITFFEITTAMAFAVFMRHPADLLLLEVGMGGRLDCTNIITKPYVSVINRISKDHTEFLGNTIAEIAREKGGIIKNATPCIVGYQDKKTYKDESKQAVSTFVDIAEEKCAPLYCAGKDWSCEPDEAGMIFSFKDTKIHLPRPGLTGDHQVENAGCALMALETLQDHFPVTTGEMKHGLSQVNWPGRLEQVNTGPCVQTLPDDWELWYDGGHNDSAGAALGQQAQKWSANDPKPLHLILGMKADKNPKIFLKPLLPYTQSITLIPLMGVGDHVKQEDLAPVMKNHNIPLYTAPNVSQACQGIAQQAEAEKGRILLCGSLYLAEQLIK